MLYRRLRAGAFLPGMPDTTDTITAEELRRLRQQKPKGQARHKFNAQVTQLDGIKFPSKLEARYYKLLRQWQQAGAIVGFLRQPEFDTGGGTKYRADFLVFHVDGSCEVVDVKGRQTKGFLRAKRQVEARYPWIGGIRVIEAAEIRQLERTA